MRGLKPSVRQSTGAAAHASRVVNPITAPVVLRTLAVAAGVGLFLSFVGAFGTSDTPFLWRSIYMVLVGCAGAMLGMASFHTVVRWGWTEGRLWIQTPMAGLLMTPPMMLVVWGGTWIGGRGAPLKSLPGFAFNSLVMCLCLTSVAVALNHSRRLPAPGATPVPAPPKFLERLPLKLRGGEVWAVSAEDHYLRLYTSRGEDLILMRLADAVAELEGLEGAQVHRSWWVARDAVVEAERGDGRAILTLKGGAKVPVSRTYAKTLRERGWF